MRLFLVLLSSVTLSFASEALPGRLDLEQLEPALPHVGESDFQTADNLVRNGGFESPFTDNLVLLNGTPKFWEKQGDFSLVNHLRLFPFSGFQCLWMKASQDSRISQDIEVKKAGKLTISFALAASRLVEGEVGVYVDDKLVGSRRYSDYWKPEETHFTVKMKWIDVVLPSIEVEAGKHRISFQVKGCQKIIDKQGDLRDMIDGFLLDAVKASVEEKKWFSGIPPLDNLAGQIVPTRTLTSYPMIGNFLGGIKASKCIGAFDPEYLNGFQHKGTTGIWQAGDQILFSEMTQWFPYQIVSQANVGGIGITGIIRMPFERPGVLVQLTLVNRTSRDQTLPLSMKLPDGEVRVVGQGASARIRVADTWDYTFTRPPKNIEPNQVTWTVKLAPGERIELGYAMEKGLSSLNRFDERGFKEAFSKSRTQWESRWRDVFTPGNPCYSGHLPIFETDDRGLYEIYYLSIVSLLEMEQDSVYPMVKRAFGSNNQWAANRAYFWDFSLMSDIYAMLDPEGMKQVVAIWLATDQNKCNAVGYDGGPDGHWYAVNDHSIFKFVDSYIRVTQDTAFLQTKIKDKTILEHLRRFASNWEQRFNKKFGLVDFGGWCWSFFECNPDYKHMAPAMNAQVVWMLRAMAGYEKQFGIPELGDELRRKAQDLAAKVKALYVPGEGVWQVLYPDGRKIISRHSYDFVTVAMTMNQDLDTATKREMIGFVERELLTDSHFMRAMSLKDAQAPDSDRSDHGPAGSYIAWPSLTVQGMADLGEYSKAANMLSDFRKAFEEEGMGQAIEFLVVPGTSRTINRVGERGGASFLVSAPTYAGSIIDGLMGYHPALDGALNLPNAGTDRGFNGRLTNVPHGDKNLTIKSDSSGIRFEER